MIAESHLRSNLLRYLTGGMTEDDRSLFEEKLLADQEFSDAVAVCEQEIIDSYASGSLPSDETASLRGWIEISPRRMQRVRMARALLVRTSKSNRNRRFLATAMATAACLLIVASVSVRMFRPQGKLSTSHSPESTNRASGVPSPGGSSESRAVILLVAESIRGEGPPATYRVSSDASVEVQILLVGGVRDGSYSLEITSTNQQILLKKENLRSRMAAAQCYIDAFFSAGAFPPGAYRAVVKGERTILTSDFVVTR